MKLCIVHLSDIHFSSKQDVAFKRREKLANRIRYSRSPDETLLLIIAGDIANKGLKAEYVVADEFFRPLLLGLGIDPHAQPSFVTVVPGNHDCNFEALGDLRPRLLADIGDTVEGLDERGETVRVLLQVQTDFSDLQRAITGEDIVADERLFSSKLYTFEQKTLEVRCFNTAWLSAKHEEPGTLGFPQSVIDHASAKTDADVVISVAHHPSNWLNPSVYQSFRKAVQQTSDFLITGHEHTLGGQIMRPFTGSSLIHFENGALQPPRSGSSEFGILHLDLSTRSWRHEDFKWSAGSYVKVSDSTPAPLFDKTERAVSLQLTRKHIKWLNDPGAGFLHPRQENLTLSDIYIYPDLKSRALSRKLKASDDLPKNILSRDVPTALLKAKRVVVAGPNDSGKTALAKMLSLDSNVQFNRFGLFLCGKSIQGKDPVTAFTNTVEAAVQAQYGKDMLGQFAGLDEKDRFLFVDDWDEVGFNKLGRTAVLERAQAQFGCIVLFVSDMFLIEEVSERQEQSPLANYEMVDIREFGFRLRGQMIWRWHGLGDTFVEDEATFARHVADSTKVVDTVLGRNLLPSYPINILTLLQTYDASTGSQNSGLGSYGQVYEALITARLAKISLKSIDIGTKITVLSRFAWRLFDEQLRELSEREWGKLIDEYFHEYGIKLDAGQLSAACEAAGLIIRGEVGFRFTYGYGYCYFVAKYFQENLADPDEGTAREDLFQRLQSLSERVYNQVNANIVIFYVFLTKDRALIDYVIAKARRIFDEFDEFDFDSDLNFVNRLELNPHPVELPTGAAEENQRKYNERRDESGEQIEPYADPAVGDVSYSRELPFEQRLIIALRYLTLMGQILRNFPGSLKADTKLELAFESFSLGLRILGAFFALVQTDAAAITKDIANVLRERMAFSGTERELLNRAEAIVAEMLREVTYCLLKRISHAVGLRELEVTYEDVSSLRDHSVPNQLIQLSIQLDHFEQFPKGDIERLAGALGGNVFTYQTLCDLVLNHLHLFPRGYQIQQWVGDTLKMKVNLPEIRGSARKITAGE